MRLDKFARRAASLRSAASRARLGHRLFHELRQHFRDCRAKNRDKMTERFSTILGKLGADAALPMAAELFSSGPDMRDSVIRYLAGLAYSPGTGRVFRQLMRRAQSQDDLTKLLFVRGLVAHRIPRSLSGRRLVAAAFSFVARPTTSFDRYAHFMLLAKYGAPHQVLTAVIQSRTTLRKDAFWQGRRWPFWRAPPE